MPDGSSLPEIKISQLPVGSEANLSDLLEASQVGSGGYVSASLTVAQVAATVAGTLPAPPVIPTTLPPSGAAGGALAGTYPNPTLVGGPLSNYAPVSSLAGYLPLAGGQLTAGATVGWTAHAQLTSPVDGNFLLTNNAGASFGYLQFGGTSNAFPALQRNGNQLTVMLADGSNRATLAANNFSVSNGLFYGAFGSIASPGIDGQFQFWNNAGTAASRLDIATDGTIKFRNRTNTADAITTFATQPTTQNDNSGATTAFVKAALAGGSSITVSDTPPASPGANMLWWNSLLGTLFIYYNDGNSTQWVPASPAGTNKLLQEVSVETGAVATGTTPLPFDDTIPQITEGNEYMTLAITPQSATSKLVIEVVCFVSSSATSPAGIAAALFQDATANALAAGFATSCAAGSGNNIKLSHVMTSGTTSATTFRVRAGTGSAGTTTFNGLSGARYFGGVMASSIVIREIAP